MFEQEIANNITKTTNDVIGQRRSIGLSELMQSEYMPQRYKPFFENEVKFWLYCEGLENSANKRFDYSNSEINSLINYLDKLKLKYSFFERDEFDKILDTAVKITFNYLCRPQTTLKWFIFRGEPVKPIQEVLLRLEPFSDYEYFKDVFNEWVTREKRERPAFENISSQEFERIVRRIDDQILVDCSADDLLDIMKPMFEFIGKSKRQLPISAAVLFFDDKNIQKISLTLEQMYNKGKETVSRRELVELIVKIIEEHNEPEADFSDVFANTKLNDAVKTHIEAKQNIFEEEDILLREATLQSHRQDVIEQNIVAEETKNGFGNKATQENFTRQNFTQGNSGNADEKLQVSNEDKTELGKTIIDKANEPNTPSTRRTSDEAILSDKMKISQKKNIVRELDDNIGKKTLSMIFKNNEEDYEDFVRSLKEAETFDEALSKIDFICLKHSIDPNSFIPLRLSRAVYYWFK